MALGLWVGLKRRLNWHISRVRHFQQFLPIESALWKQILYHRHRDLGLPKDDYLATQCVATMIVICLRCSIDICLPLVLRCVVEKLSRQEVAWREIVILGALRFAVSRAALQGIQRALSTRISHHLHQSFKAFCYGHIMDLSADYHLSTRVGESMTAISWGGSLIDSWLELVFSALPLMADLTTALFTVGLLFPPVTLGILVATMAFLVALNGIWVTQNVPKHQMTNARRRNQEIHILNTLLCWRTVSECRKISFEKQRHGAKSETYRKGLQELDDSALILDAGQDIAIIVGFLAACSYILEDISKAHSNPLQMLTLLMYWSRATESVRSAGSMYARVINETRNTTLLQSALQRMPSINPRSEFPAFHFKSGAVTIDDLSFSYDGRREVIKSLSFAVKAGQKVALVGQTGSGKSTIFRLLSRHFDPSSGRILVDGQDLRHVALDSYREVLGIVSQNTVLMNASIRENVAYPCLNASDEQIVSACKAAEIHETIMQLPRQYDQEVGELAGKLSGGEIQRLVLARLYVQDPRIVLLDEATSNLDGITEQKTWALLNTFCRGRTTFIITHRLSTIQNVDKIIVMDRGAKIEEGTHSELIANGEGSYLASLKAQNSTQVWS